MKKYISLIAIIIAFCIFFVLWQNFETTNSKREALKIQASTYLHEKYSKYATITDVGYYDSVYFFNNVHFANEHTKFQVMYVASASCFEDDYLESILTDELKAIISNQLIGFDITESDIFISSMNGPPFQLSKRLYEYYQMLGRYPKIKDIENKESFDRVYIYTAAEVEKEILSNIENRLKALNLPIKHIEFKTK